MAALPSIEDLIARVKQLEVCEKELDGWKQKRKLVNQRYRAKHAESIKQQKAKYYQDNKRAYAEAQRKRRARIKLERQQPMPQPV